MLIGPVMFVVFDIFLLISVAALAIAQASQVARNVTTNELANWHRCGLAAVCCSMLLCCFSRRAAGRVTLRPAVPRFGCLPVCKQKGMHSLATASVLACLHPTVLHPNLRSTTPFHNTRLTAFSSCCFMARPPTLAPPIFHLMPQVQVRARPRRRLPQPL